MASDTPDERTIPVAGCDQGLPVDLVPARMLHEFVYCPRVFHLEWVQREWADSADTLAGEKDHRRVDVPSGELPDPADVAGVEGEARSVELSAPESGIVAKLDLVVTRDGAVIPVDYKHGRAPQGDLPVWDADRIQLGAQAVVLRENGYRCDEAIVYYVKSRRRVSIVVDDVLVADVRAAVRGARAAAEDPNPPPPLRDSPKCPGCSLAGICLPDETNRLMDAAAAEGHDGDPAGVEDAEDGNSSRVRRRGARLLYPGRLDARPLYVQSGGSRVGKDGSVLAVEDRDGNKRKVRLLDVSQVSLFGSIQISAAALAELMHRGIPVCHFGFGSWFQGITHAIGPRNCRVRVPQYRWAGEASRCLDLARGFVTRKVQNCRTLLRRNGSNVDQRVLDDLDRLAEHAAASEHARSLEALLGIEGSAARVYFGSFGTMLKATDVSTFDFQSRNRRPPRDPVNALLSLAYSVLSRDWTVALLAVGLDPFLGFFHQPRHGRAALALDLMEEFRPIIADSVVLQLINNGEVQQSDFIQRGPAVSLTEAGRRKFFDAYERRMSHEIRHPLFGYRVTYRCLLELQARLFARHLTGELPTYDGFKTR